jgi:hypothetical protein
MDLNEDPSFFLARPKRVAWHFSVSPRPMAACRQERLVYYAFDLLWRDGDLPNTRSLSE